MELDDGRFIYSTYLVDRHLSEYQHDKVYFPEFNDIYDHVRTDIYKNNIDKITTVYQIDENSRIEELQYKSYNLIFLADKMNVYLVNLFRKNKNYPKDLDVILYGFENVFDDINHFIKRIELNNRFFTCLNVAKAFIEFNKQCGGCLKRDKNKEFWSRVERYLKISGDGNDYFGYSQFGNYIIIYTYRYL